MGRVSTLADLAEAIPDAVERLEGVAARTPVQLNHRLSSLTGSEVWLKREDPSPCAPTSCAVPTTS